MQNSFPQWSYLKLRCTSMIQLQHSWLNGKHTQVIYLLINTKYRTEQDIGGTQTQRSTMGITSKTCINIVTYTNWHNGGTGKNNSLPRHCHMYSESVKLCHCLRARSGWLRIVVSRWCPELTKYLALYPWSLFVSSCRDDSGRNCGYACQAMRGAGTQKVGRKKWVGERQVGGRQVGGRTMR